MAMNAGADAQEQKRVAAIVLAAGQSSRMGQPKQLVSVAGEPLVVRAVKVARASGAEVVMVVTGAYADQVTAALARFQLSGADQLQIVPNPHYRSGQASSIRAALQALAADCAAALFLPVDQPFVPPALLQQLIHAWRQGARLAASAVDGTLRGAPALFDRTLFPELLRLEGDVGARSLLHKYRHEIVAVPATAGELHDVDTPADLAAIAVTSE